MTIQALARACANAAWAILDEKTLWALSDEDMQQARLAILQLIIAERATLDWPYDLEASGTAHEMP